MNDSLTSYSATLLVAFSTCVTLVILVRSRQSPKSELARMIGVYTALIVSVASCAIALPDRNLTIGIGLDLIRFDRATVILTVAGTLLGYLCADACRRDQETSRRANFGVYLLVVSVLCVATLKDRISPFLATPESVAGGRGLVERAVVEGFAIQEVAQLEIAPTALAVAEDGAIYVAGYAGLAFQKGVVVRVATSPDGQVRQTVVANHLNRPHGIAIHDGVLYVSRSGQYTKTQNGEVVQVPTGSVTRLEDHDGDFVIDQYDDIITDLPGAGLPDGLHQNNGIAFDDEGHLYTTVGIISDHGPPQLPFEGTILRSKTDGSELTEYCRGLRNPYGIAINDNGELFCTDNDPNNVDGGDEINRIVQGNHYGHPYDTNANLEVQGVTPPIIKCRSAQGLCYAPEASLPDGFGDHIYVACYGDNHINRLVFKEVDGKRTADLEFFAYVPSALDVAYGKNSLYAISHHQKKLYVIRETK